MTNRSYLKLAIALGVGIALGQAMIAAPVTVPGMFKTAYNELVTKPQKERVTAPLRAECMKDKFNTFEESNGKCYLAETMPWFKYAHTLSPEYCLNDFKILVLDEDTGYRLIACRRILVGTDDEGKLGEWQ
jgi:hypothetical protein